MNNDEKIEKKILQIVATDKVYIPLSSLDSKIKKRRQALASSLDLEGYDNRFNGERVYAEVVSEDVKKARGMKEGIEAFSQKYPVYGDILRNLIDEKRSERETHLYFNLKQGRRLAADDYLAVMASVGFTGQGARVLYPRLMEVSRKLSSQRDNEQRSVLIG